MCSIFGIGFFKGHEFKDNPTITGVVSRLFKAAEVRGRKAAGLSIMRERQTHVLRRPLSGSELVSTKEYLDFMQEGLRKNKVGENNNRVMSIIGHCRYPTQGSELEILNNHPQVIDNIIGVHNGVITNDHALFAKFEQVITRKAQVDTEIIFQLIKHFNNESKETHTIEAIKEASKYLVGSYTCGLQNTNHPYNLYLFRKHNPLSVIYYPKIKVLFFASNETFIRDAYDDFVNSTMSTQSKEIEVANYTGMAFNLWNHTKSGFKLKQTDKNVRQGARRRVGWEGV